MADQLLGILLNGLLGREVSSGSPRHRWRELVRGDVLCVRNGLANRYGIYRWKPSTYTAKALKAPNRFIDALSRIFCRKRKVAPSACFLRYMVV